MCVRFNGYMCASFLFTAPYSCSLVSHPRGTEFFLYWRLHFCFIDTVVAEQLISIAGYLRSIEPSLEIFSLRARLLSNPVPVTEPLENYWTIWHCHICGTEPPRLSTAVLPRETTESGCGAARAGLKEEISLDSEHFLNQGSPPQSSVLTTFMSFIHHSCL